MIQKKANKFSNVSKFRINVFQLKRINLNVLLVKRKISVTIRHIILSNNSNLL